MARLKLTALLRRWWRTLSLQSLRREREQQQGAYVEIGSTEIKELHLRGSRGGSDLLRWGRGGSVLVVGLLPAETAGRRAQVLSVLSGFRDQFCEFAMTCPARNTTASSSTITRQ